MNEVPLVLSQEETMRWQQNVVEGFVRWLAHSRWWAQSAPITFGPAPASVGSIQLTITPSLRQVTVQWEAAWRRLPHIQIHLPNTQGVIVPAQATSMVIPRERS